MSILSGLMDKFKKEIVDKVADAIQNVKEDVTDSAPPSDEFPVGTVIPGGVPNGYVVGSGSAQPAEECDSDWYDHVPVEECQYNFSGTYLEYFKKVFSEDFPQYELKFDTITEWRRYAFTFLKDGNKALIVELMTEHCSANSLRKSCSQKGIPYLRFYFDHEGWWNTRAYVDKRVSEALAR